MSGQLANSVPSVTQLFDAFFDADASQSATNRVVTRSIQDDLHSDEGAHYSSVTKDYHTAFFYTGEYEDWQKQNILARLQLRPNHKFVDIGGGTGRFAFLLRQAAGLEQPALCVDPSAGMLEQAAQLEGIETSCQCALQFAQSDGDGGGYDRAMIKEVVHHLHDECLVSMYTGILGQLNPGGVLLTCTRPHVVEYPFFPEALAVWSRQQPPMEHYIKLMRQAGFEDIVCEVAEYPATLDTEWWLEMVGNRFWSTFSAEHFSDEELAAGIAEIKVQHGGAKTISFTEKMVFITATKPDKPDAHAGAEGATAIL